MEVGDLVQPNNNRFGSAGNAVIPKPVGVVVDVIQKKVWRTHIQGKKINWDVVEPEAHAVVLWPDGPPRPVPAVDLEVIK
jgi:hypothetical protein